MLSTLTYSKLIIWRFLLLNSKSTFQESLNSHDSRNCRPMDDQKITMIGIRWACLYSDGNSSLLKSRCSRFSQILTFVRRKLLEKVGDVRSRLFQFFFRRYFPLLRSSPKRVQLGTDPVTVFTRSFQILLKASTMA
jgi:hypothetical protein